MVMSMFIKSFNFVAAIFVIFSWNTANAAQYTNVQTNRPALLCGSGVCSNGSYGASIALSGFTLTYNSGLDVAKSAVPAFVFSRKSIVGNNWGISADKYLSFDPSGPGVYVHSGNYVTSFQKTTSGTILADKSIYSTLIFDSINNRYIYNNLDGYSQDVFSSTGVLTSAYDMGAGDIYTYAYSPGLSEIELKVPRFQ
jgi:hypothetical protein